MGRFEANLPAVLEPEGEICVNVKIPNHPDYVKLFLRAMRMLEVNRMYERDEEHSAKIVCEQWRTRTLTPLIEALATGNGCPDEINEYDCIEYPSYASFIEYVPDNPFDSSSEVPPNYLTHAWWKWGRLETVLPDWIDNPLADFIEDLTQYHENDALTWIGSLPYNGIGEIIDNSFPFPYIKIHVSGKGTIRMNFLSFPLGGRIFAEVDEMPNIIDILTSSFLDPDSRVIDTDRDVTTFPMEQWPVIGVKLEVPEDGDHIVYCMLMPRVEAGVDFFGFGGGLRSVELCGGLRPINMPPLEPPPPLEGIIELKPEFQFTTECGLEYRLRDEENNIVQDWTPVAGWVDNAAVCFVGETGPAGPTGPAGEDCEGCDDESDGNTYPPPPTDYEPETESGGSAICASAYYISEQLQALVADMLEDAGTITFEEFLTDMLGIGGFKATSLKHIWDFLVANENPDLMNEVNDAHDAIAEAFFCALLDIEQARAAIEDNEDITDDAKEAILKALDSVNQSKINNWSFIGSQTANEDCSGFCSWVVVWDFAGTYVPVGDEDAIIPGNTWEASGANYIAGVGYQGIFDVWTISHELPPDCKVKAMIHNCNKNVPCASVGVRSTWRGTSGTDPEGFSPEATITSNTPINQIWTVLPISTGAELSQMVFRHDHFFCGGEHGSQTHWVRMEGTGARPGI